MINDGKSSRADNLSTKTDADGRFFLQPEREHFSVFVVDDRGYAETTEDQLRESQNVLLQSWAKIKGRMLLNENIAVDQPVRLMVNRTHGPSKIWYWVSTDTDLDGTLAFDKVPPGVFVVGRAVQFQRAESIIGLLDLAKNEHLVPSLGSW